MTIEGDYALFAHLETVYLGCLARRTLIMRNVHEVVEAANGKPILYFPARHDHWLVQTGDGWAAHVAGAIGVSTDAQASWWGGRGVGTVPHGLIAAYGGDTALAARKFADRFAADMNVTVLVDFANDSVQTALEVADALGGDLWGVRLDTSDKLADDGAPGAPRRRRADRRQRRARAARPRRARRARLPRRADRRLRRLHGRPDPRVRGRRRAGRRLRRRLVADPRLERLHGRRRDGDGRPRGKVGRELRPNPRLSRVTPAGCRYELALARRSVVRYALTSANDAPDRDPRDWTLQGSERRHDVDDARHPDGPGPSASASRPPSTTFANGTAYSYYRLDITRQPRRRHPPARRARSSPTAHEHPPPRARDAQRSSAAGPRSGYNAKPAAGCTGLRALQYARRATRPTGRAYSYNKVFDVDVTVTRRPSSRT